jgi:hypothetical protein
VGDHNGKLDDSRDVRTVPDPNDTYSQSSVTCVESEIALLSQLLLDHTNDIAFSEEIRLQGELIELYISEANLAESETCTHTDLPERLVYM